MALQPRKTMDHPDVKAMQAQRDERAKSNEAAMKRMDESKPTPTQEENDLAKLGIPVEQKQDDGSGRTVITTVTVANEPLGTPVVSEDRPLGTPVVSEDRPVGTPQSKKEPASTSKKES